MRAYVPRHSGTASITRHGGRNGRGSGSRGKHHAAVLVQLHIAEETAVLSAVGAVIAEASYFRPGLGRVVQIHARGAFRLNTPLGALVSVVIDRNGGGVLRARIRRTDAECSHHDG